MDAIQLIKKDHERVTALFQRFNDGGGLTGLVRRVTGNGTSQRKKRTTAEMICRELDVHARVEEEIFYPAVRATGDADLARQLDEALKEHASVKEQVAYLLEHPDAEDLDSRVSALQHDVDHHVREEENEMLPRVEELIPDRERVALGRRMQARKQGRGAPASPRTASARRATARTATRKRGTTGGRKRGTPAAVKRRARKATKVRRTRAKRKRAS